MKQEHAPEWDENVHNLGLRKEKMQEKDKWVDTDKIPDSRNYSPISSPDKSLMEKEEGKIRSEIKKLKKKIEKYGPNDQIGVVKAPELARLRESIGQTEADEIREEIERLEEQDSLDKRPLKDPARTNRQEKIKALRAKLIELKKKDLPEEMAA
jgi:hypothetical protein